LSHEMMAQIDDEFQLTNSRNCEIAQKWLLLAVSSNYEAAYPRLNEFLHSIGREKLIKPLYEELMKSVHGRQMALTIYRAARPTYHSIVVTKIDKLFNADSIVCPRKT
jgi:leukotriene-A4 hydrolase